MDVVGINSIRRRSIVFVKMRTVLSAAALVLWGIARMHLANCIVNFAQVNIDEGILHGYNAVSWNGTGYFGFKGIPYAKPPIGELRFKAPQEAEPWDGIRSAVKHGSVCPQYGQISGVLEGEEDCLFLNVYSPSLADERLPVMVWFYGGGYISGSGNDDIYGPEYFVQSRVILVTVNYRLGALGFLSTGDAEAPGNAGLKDQVAALKWVQRNIAKFGGDPKTVTIFGESAGGGSVHFHILSPMSTGLFSRAISQSGVALRPVPLAGNVTENILMMAKELGAKLSSRESVKEALEFLRNASAEDIVNFQESMKTNAEGALRFTSLFRPSVEKKIDSEEAFLPDSPQNITESGNYNAVPWIIGYNDKESYLLYSEIIKPATWKVAFDNPGRLIPVDIRNPELRVELAESIREFYFHNEPITMENVGNLFDFYADTRFNFHIQRAARMQLMYNRAPIYFYRFSYGGAFNLWKKTTNISLPGASHVDEIGYMFFVKLLPSNKPIIGSQDEYVLRTVSRMWTNFAKYGNPTPDGDPFTWKPVTVDQFNFMNISGWDTKPDFDPDRDRYNFWADAYAREARLQQEIKNDR